MMSGDAQAINNADLVFTPSKGIVYVEYGQGKSTTRKFVTHIQPRKEDSHSDDTSEDDQVVERSHFNFSEIPLPVRSFTFCNLQDIHKVE